MFNYSFINGRGVLGCAIENPSPFSQLLEICGTVSGMIFAQLIGVCVVFLFEKLMMISD